MKIFGLEFASWDVPVQRRIQTLAVFTFLSIFLFSGIVLPLVFVYGFFTSYYFLSWIYLVWMYYDLSTPGQGGRAKRRLRNLVVWRIFASYFPIKLIKTADLDTNKNYIFAFHPHGVGAFGCICNFVSEGTGFGTLFPGITARVMTLAGNFMVPIHRELLMFLGFYPVNKESIHWLLTKEGQGNAVIIAVGGAAEALDARPGEATLTLKNRKGFVKMALKHGASLVPIYSFGENDLYYQVNNPTGSLLRRLQDNLKNVMGVSLPLIMGRGVFNYSIGILPHRRPIVTVVGEPIEVEQRDSPTAEEIDKVHEVYLKQLTQLYDRFKAKYGNPDKELVFT